MTIQTTQKETPFTGFWHNKNYVWAGAMHLAWTELCESIIKDALALNTTDETVLSLVEAFNKPIFSKKDLAEDSYYTKAGLGNATVRQINQESKAKFPSKTFEDLIEDLSDTGIIAFAYFFKKFKSRKLASSNLNNLLYSLSYHVSRSPPPIFLKTFEDFLLNHLQYEDTLYYLFARNVMKK